MYVDLGFQQYSLSDGAAKAFQLSFTVLQTIKKIRERKANLITFHSKESLTCKQKLYILRAQ